MQLNNVSVAVEKHQVYLKRKLVQSISITQTSNLQISCLKHTPNTHSTISLQDL